MKLKKIAALTALALVPGISSAIVGYFAHGYGMKSIGMGGVGIALPQDGLAAASNPVRSAPTPKSSAKTGISGVNA